MRGSSVLRWSLLGVLPGLLLVGTPDRGWAKKRAGAQLPKEAGEQTTRAIGELAGKFKWGMSPQEVIDIIEKDIRKNYEPKIHLEQDPFKQDAIRRDMLRDFDDLKSSYIKFDGQKTGWDVSIVDREYGHKNNESMLVLQEQSNQRRFFFFWNEKLYKQFIALDAGRFKGKTFDEFAEIIQDRYGKAQINFAKMQTQDEMALDNLEWPPSGDYVLRAYDQSGFYGNFCLALLQKSVYQEVEKERAQNSPPRTRRVRHTDIDSVSKEDSPADPNADIVDQVLGRQELRTNQGGNK